MREMRTNSGKKKRRKKKKKEKKKTMWSDCTYREGFMLSSNKNTLCVHIKYSCIKQELRRQFSIFKCLPFAYDSAIWFIVLYLQIPCHCVTHFTAHCLWLVLKAHSMYTILCILLLNIVHRKLDFFHYFIYL